MWMRLLAALRIIEGGSFTTNLILVAGIAMVMTVLAVVSAAQKCSLQQGQLFI